MSGFASELSVFVGMTSSDFYTSPFRVVTVLLAAVGLILTPIYLLSMLRQLFFGTEAPLTCNLEQPDQSSNIDERAVCFGTSCVLPMEAHFSDAKPREVFVAACFLIPILAIGFYPKLATNLYDATTIAVNAEVRQSYVQVAEARGSVIPQEHPSLFAQAQRLEEAPALAMLQ